MEDNIFSKLPEDQIFTELNGEILDEIIERANNREDGDKLCIIIDDMASQLKNGDVVQKALKQIAMNKRHLGIYSTFIIKSNMEKSSIRDGKTISMIILFYSKSVKMKWKIYLLRYYHNINLYLKIYKK
jgi:hypothetical protein